MLSIIVTAYREERTIAKVVRNLLDSEFSGLGAHEIDRKWELILVAPDAKTRSVAKQELERLNINPKQYKLLVDEQKGKPAALNMCFAEARGSWLLLTDGDVTFRTKGVWELIEATQTELARDHVERQERPIGGLSVRPVAKLPKTTRMNYWGALLADAAHHKRTLDLTPYPSGRSRQLVPKREFFPLSGYGMIIRNLNWRLPEDVLVDDAYISYELYNKGYRLGYSPLSEVAVKYADNLRDYYLQKKRSTGGFLQLWQYGVVRPQTKSRSFWRELEYFWFPLRYALTFRQFYWSLLLFPTRLWLWVKIYWERNVQKKSFGETWKRVESTK